MEHPLSSTHILQNLSFSRIGLWIEVSIFTKRAAVGHKSRPSASESDGNLEREAVPVCIVYHASGISERGADNHGFGDPVVEAALDPNRSYQVGQVLAEAIGHQGADAAAGDQER